MSRNASISVLLVSTVEKRRHSAEGRMVSRRSRHVREEPDLIAALAAATDDIELDLATRPRRAGLNVLLGEVHRSSVVHLQDASSLLAAAFAVSAWLCRRPTVVTAGRQATVRFSRYGRLQRRLVAGPIEGWIARGAAWVEVVDPPTRDRMLLHGLDPDKLTLRGQAIDTDTFRPVSSAECTRLRRRHGLPLTIPLLIFGTASGSLSESSPTNQRVQIRSTVSESPVADGTLDLAPADEMELAELYQASDVYVRSATNGELTVAAEQAMACGLPVVSADDLVPKDYGLDHRSFLFHERSTEGVEAAIVGLLADVDLRARMAMDSLRTSQEHFSRSRRALDYVELYRALSAPPAQPEFAPADTILRRHFPLALFLTLALGLGLLFLVRGPIAHLAPSSFERQSKSSTSISFPAPLSLPKAVRSDGRLSFTFAVANQSTIDRTYRFTVSETGSRGYVEATSGVLHVRARMTVDRSVDARAAELGPNLTVRVSLRPSGLFLLLHVAELPR